MNARLSWLQGNSRILPSDVRLDAADGAAVRGDIIRQAHARINAALRYVGDGGRTVRLDALQALHAPLTMVRLDAGLAARTNAEAFGATVIDRPRGLDYDPLLTDIPAISVPVGAETYNMYEGDVSGKMLPYMQGQNNAVNPFRASYQETVQLPVHTWYADDVENDWLDAAIQGEIGIDRRPAIVEAIQRSATDTQYTLLRSGITGYTAHTLQSLPMARKQMSAVTWSATMTDAEIDTGTAEIVRAIAAQRIASPKAFQPKRIRVASSIHAVLVGRTNYAGGGSVNAYDLFAAKLAAGARVPTSAVEVVDYLNDIGGSGLHGVWIPMDPAPGRGGYHGRIVAMSPTIVASWPHEGRLLTRWAVRIGGNIQPITDGALMIHVPVS